MGALRTASLVTSLAFVGLVYLLSGWACESFNPLTGEGGGGLLLTFFVLPVTAGALTMFAIWPLTKGAALASGVLVSVGAFVVAVFGC